MIRLCREHISGRGTHRHRIRQPDVARYRGRVLTLLLTRHGHTTRSEPEQYLGQSVPASLTERGLRDAKALAERLADVPIDLPPSAAPHLADLSGDGIPDLIVGTTSGGLRFYRGGR